MNIKQEAALKYAELGWYVLPIHYLHENGDCSCGDKNCKSPGKHPQTPNGATNATRNKDVLLKWFENDLVNLAIVAGKSGLSILDIDPRNGGNETFESLINKHGKLPDTAMQFSGGGGVHYVFQSTQGKKLKHIGGGIDSLNGNKYFLVYPSKTQGDYDWEGSSDPLEGQVLSKAPYWLLEEDTTAAKPIQSVGHGFLLQNQIDDLQSALKYICADDYETWIKVGQALHSSDSNEAFEVWDKWSQTSDKYQSGETTKKWQSFTKTKGLHVESIFYWAQQNGWICTPPKDEVEIRLTKPHTPKQAPIPQHLLNPPGILGDITKQIVATARMPQPVYAVNAAISLVATLAARKVQNETGLRTNIYLVSLGSTGSGKDHARNYIKNALHALGKDEQLGGEDIASGQGLMSRAAISPDAVFQIDELGHFLSAATDNNAASHKVSVLTNLMKLFSSASSVVTGTEYANQKMNERQTIEYPCINLHGTSTDGTFYEALKGAHILDGYLNRMVVTQTDTPRPTRQRIRPAIKPTQNIIDWYEKFEATISKGQGLLGIQPENPVEVKMTRKAWLLFDKLEVTIDQRMEERRGTGLDALYVRVWEHAAKIALVLGVGKDTPLIDEVEAIWAIDFVMYWNDRLVNEAQFRIADSEFGRTMNLVLKQIMKAGKGGQTEGKIFNYRHLRETTPRLRKEVLEALVGNGEILIEDTPDKRKARKFIAAEYA